MKTLLTISIPMMLLAGFLLLHRATAGQPGVVHAQFIYTEAPFPSCHASTIEETPDGLVAAWFGGKKEGDPGVGIWFARHADGRWSEPVEIADGVQSTELRYPCWNPVLYQLPEGPLLLFYKVGPSPSTWWGELKTSVDGGRTWSPARRFPDGFLGPIKNKPIATGDHVLLCGSSTEMAGRWQVHIERLIDWNNATTWEKSESLCDGESIRAIQPTFLRHSDGRLQTLCRSKQGKIVESWSADQGKTWTPLALGTLPNPNSGIDAVTLDDGRHLLVYNHTTLRKNNRSGPRSPLNVAVSADGRTWRAAVVLEREPGEYSYPAVIQTAGGLVHVTYTWRRQRIKHVVLDPDQFVLEEIAPGMP